MNPLARLLLSALGAAALLAHAHAQGVTIVNEHVDFRILYHPAGGNLLEIVLRNENTGVNYASNQVVIRAGTNAQLTVPNNPNFTFLGNPGDPIWILPQSQNPTLPFLGVSAEGIGGGIFSSALDFKLKAVKGRSHFYAWQSGAFGSVTVKMNSRDGISDADKTQPAIGSHEHLNWGFNSNGIYRVTFQAGGQRTGESTNIASPDTTFVFYLLPLSPFESWQTNHWPAYGPAHIVDPGADPDGDGIPNLLEYALDLHPSQPDTGGLPAVTFVNVGPALYGAVAFTRVKAATDLLYQVQAASDLVNPVWQTLGNVVSVMDHGATETVTVRDDLAFDAVTNRFYRLRVTWLLAYP